MEPALFSSLIGRYFSFSTNPNIYPVSLDSEFVLGKITTQVDFGIFGFSARKSITRMKL
jgi:hypothetical protein